MELDRVYSKMRQETYSGTQRLTETINVMLTVL